MDYLVTRLFDGGRVVPHHVRHANTVRGILTVKQEEDSVRHRAALVARVSGPSIVRPVPPLYDVILIASTGAVWTLSGYERIQSGTLQHEYTLGQSWLVTPAPLEDLRKAEAEWARLAEILAKQASPRADG